MKKLALLTLMLMAGTAFGAADGALNKSSFTTTNDSAYIAARALDKIIVGVSSTGGVLKIYNSTFTTSVLISSVSLTVGNPLDFGDLQVKGIYYVLVGNANGVTILYK